MERPFIISGIIALIYIIIKFLEIRFVKKEPKPIKELIRETVLVFISSISGLFIYQNIEPEQNIKNQTAAFTGKADF